MPAKKSSKRPARARSKKNPPAESKGRKDGATQIVAQDLREKAFEMYSQGKSAAEIADAIQRSERTVYAYLGDCRLQLIATKKDHFDQRMALLLDDQLDTIAAHHRLLADEAFIKGADPERLKAIGQNLGILTDKCFVLLAAAGRGRTATAEGPAGAQAVSG